MFSVQPTGIILTPCIGVCALDALGYCEGCHRTGAEIAAWRSLSDEQRRHFMAEVLPQRERERS
ncbi:hypothetical protein DFR29_10793 [Tahibacter aquaticus]|jgi:predicted Fe-S protein YdhL (DUF1289 family)|uniref:Fe-S protein YdhL (DUF1289 family) n=1 Tax=Tahibacter aquaticus TaxID=520092 RepID=A0A4R6YWM6_9GAMM|nr:DUF1289 domain-containing protein [Tahibacter aquaticus]TDR43087.1 hypothetical protein DFR29_10793 [Tahibacter aquaticus]